MWDGRISIRRRVKRHFPGLPYAAKNRGGCREDRSRTYHCIRATRQNNTVLAVGKNASLRNRIDHAFISITKVRQGSL